MEFHVCTPGRIQLVLDLKLNMTIYSQGIPEAVNYVGYLHHKKHKKTPLLFTNRQCDLYWSLYPSF